MRNSICGRHKQLDDADQRVIGYEVNDTHRAGAMFEITVRVVLRFRSVGTGASWHPVQTCFPPVVISSTLFDVAAKGTQVLFQ
jgi:hypothetical protein